MYFIRKLIGKGICMLFSLFQSASPDFAKPSLVASSAYRKPQLASNSPYHQYIIQQILLPLYCFFIDSRSCPNHEFPIMKCLTNLNLLHKDMKHPRIIIFTKFSQGLTVDAIIQTLDEEIERDPHLRHLIVCYAAKKFFVVEKSYKTKPKSQFKILEQRFIATSPE